jgi:hypothetical protein
MSSVSTSPVQEIAARHGVDITQITASAARADQFMSALRSLLQEQFPPDTLPGLDLVVIGSVGKRQCTHGSDIDFFGMVDQPLEPGRGEPIIRAIFDKALAMDFDMPFAQGITGTFVPRSEVETVNLIGDDTRRVFRRMTVVTASVSVYQPELRAKTLRTILSAFVGRDREPRVRGVIDQILTFAHLGNMVAEWRTEDRKSADGGLVPWVKCFTLYRIDQAASLVATIRASMLSEGKSREDLIEMIAVQIDRPPLERLLGWYDDVSPAGKAAIASLIAVANDSLSLLHTPGARQRLLAMEDDEPTREIRRAFEHQMRNTNQALVQLFFHEPRLRPWAELGLFG